MSSVSPSARRRAQKTAASQRRPEARPCYAQRRIVGSVEIRFPLPPTTNSLFALVGGTRIKTPRYRAWRAQAVLAISCAALVPGRIAGLCDVEIHLPPYSGRPDRRVDPCLDAAVAAGILADDGDRYVRRPVRIVPAPGATDVRMILQSLPVEEADAAEIELRTSEGQSAQYIAVALGLSLGQVETVLAAVAARNAGSAPPSGKRGAHVVR